MNEDQINETILELRVANATQAEILNAIKETLQRIEGSLVTKESHAALEQRVERVETIVGRVAWATCGVVLLGLLGMLIPNAQAFGF